MENTNDFITESVDQKAYKQFIKYINDSKYNDTHTKIASVSSHRTMHLSHLSSTQLYKIGNEYELGLNDRTINIRKAIRCYKKAAGKGKINAYIKLGDIQMEKSLEFYKTAADLDNQIGKDKYDQLNAIITKSKADNGDASAMNQYGVFLDSRKGVEIDKVKACEYYKRSADNGNVDGMYNYARILEDGENGVPVDYIEACKYFKSAADLGDENSKEELELAEKKND